MRAPAVPTAGAHNLAEAVQEEASRRGWRQQDLEGKSKEAVVDEDDGRQRKGLSERMWQTVWRGQKTHRMDPYSYHAIDKTFGWLEGTARALHHDQDPPVLRLSEREAIENRMTELEEEVASLRSDLVATRATVDGLVKMVATVIGRAA